MQSPEIPTAVLTFEFGGISERIHVIVPKRSLVGLWGSGRDWRRNLRHASDAAFNRLMKRVDGLLQATD